MGAVPTSLSRGPNTRKVCGDQAPHFAGVPRMLCCTGVSSVRLPLHRAERGRTLRNHRCRPILWPDFRPRVSNLLPSMRAGPRTRPLQMLAVFRRGFHRCHADVHRRWSMGRPGGVRAFFFLGWQCVPATPRHLRWSGCSRFPWSHQPPFFVAAPACLLLSASIRRAPVLRRQGTQGKKKLGRP